LALLSNETTLFKPLNLEKSNSSIDPEDFYSYVIKILKEYISEKFTDNLSVKQRESFVRIDKIVLDRSALKKSIMTIPYNAGLYSIVDYLIEGLGSEIKHEEINSNHPY